MLALFRRRSLAVELHARMVQNGKCIWDYGGLRLHAEKTHSDDVPEPETDFVCKESVRVHDTRTTKGIYTPKVNKAYHF